MKTICWLRVTDYMQGWIRDALGGALVMEHQPMVSLDGVVGAREAFELPVADEEDRSVPGSAVSDLWMHAMITGVDMDPTGMEETFGVTEATLRQYLPIECPLFAFTEDGVFRPWSSGMVFGRAQAIALQRVLREAFWRGVKAYSKRYALAHAGEHYAQEEMIEAFCHDTHTDDTHVQAMRREWQRRCKKEKESLTAGCRPR